MEPHPYIKLVVDTELSPLNSRQWLQTVQNTLPDGLLGQTEIVMNSQRKTTNFYKTKTNNCWNYIIPLTRDPNIAEVKKVAEEWNLAYPEGDFEIDYSSVGNAEATYKDLEYYGLKEIAMEVAKLSHNSWLTEMSEQGWRYSNQFNQRTKTNPNLLPWDQLSKQYQLKELKRIEKLISIFDNMNLKLVRK